MTETPKWHLELEHLYQSEWAELVLKGIANLKFKFEINIEGENGGKLPHKCCLYILSRFHNNFQKHLVS